jgi:hypothetical protein
MADKKFATGIYADAPHPNAPEFVKARLSIKVQDAIAFLKEHEKQSGYVDLDVKESREGKWYVELNEYQPKERSQREPNVQRGPRHDSTRVSDLAYPKDDINPDDIPFN